MSLSNYKLKLNIILSLMKNTFFHQNYKKHFFAKTTKYSFSKNCSRKNELSHQSRFSRQNHKKCTFTSKHVFFHKNCKTHFSSKPQKRVFLPKSQNTFSCQNRKNSDSYKNLFSRQNRKMYFPTKP